MDTLNTPSKNNESAVTAMTTLPVLSYLPTSTVPAHGDDSKANPRPTVDLSLFPADLKSERIWCTWRYETLPNGKATKVPYRDLSRKASSTNPETWTTLDAALANLANPNSSMDGVGCFVSDGRVWTDLDDCVHDGFIEPWALEVVTKLGTYSELSPSGEGIHCYSIGLIPTTNKTGDKINGCEMYASGRFFTVTGDHIDTTPNTLKPSEHITAIHADLKANKLRPYELLKGDKANSAPKPKTGLVVKAAADFDKLRSGDATYIAERYNNDRSAADQAFANLLAEKLGGDFNLIEAAFSASGLSRDKWTSREDYRERTIKKAIEYYEETKANRGQVEVVNPDDWRSIFHTMEETLNAPPLTFAINGFLQEAGITMIGGPSGHSKTFVALAMVRSLLTGERLFDYFDVVSPAKRILYLVPESSLSPFAHRLRKFKLVPYVGDRLFYYTLSKDNDGKPLRITDPRLLKAAEGADVFLDTAVRFMEGSDENSSAEARVFADNLFALLRAGARTVTGIHHAPKGLNKHETLSLENVLRGSGDIGAALATCWGVYQVDKAANRIYVDNVKPRDFQPCEPFLLEGRPYIDDTGNFKMVGQPGMCEPLSRLKPNSGKKAGAKEDPQKAEKLERILKLKAAGESNLAISKAVGISDKTVKTWVAEHEFAQGVEAAFGGSK
jgi:hypothetical protein